MKKTTQTIWEKIIEKLQPADLIAVIVIIGYLVLQWRGVITMLNSAVLVIIGAYFGSNIKSHIKK